MSQILRLKLRWCVSAAALTLLLGCGKTDTSGTGNKSESGQGRLLAVSYQTLNNPFFIDLNEGLKQVVEGHGDRLVALDAQFDSLKQKNDISDLLMRNAAAVFINPVNWEGVKGTLLQARDRHIPCIIVDAPVKEEDLVLCQVASDNVEAGHLAAQALAKVKPNAKIVILHLSVNKACLDRVAGFSEEVAKHPGMKILDIQEGKGTTEGARPVMRDLLGRFPDLDAVFPINDPSALGAISALESAGRLKEVTVVTVDGSREGIAAIKAGKLQSTSAQFPREIGRIAAEKLYEHLAGKPVEKNIKVPVKLITAENTAEFAKP
jgi:ribose transport system substrate-binding protein